MDEELHEIEVERRMEMENTKWVYIQSEPGLYTLGFYALNGGWHADSDHGKREEAAERVHYLNGNKHSK